MVCNIMYVVYEVGVVPPYAWQISFRAGEYEFTAEQVDHTALSFRRNPATYRWPARGYPICTKPSAGRNSLVSNTLHIADGMETVIS